MLPNVNVVNRALYFQTYGVLAPEIAEGQCNTFDPETGTFGEVQSLLDENNVAWRAEIGRAHVRTPVTNAHLVCRLLLEKKNQTTITSTTTNKSRTFIQSHTTYTHTTTLPRLTINT